MNDSVIISNPSLFEEKKKQLIIGGASALHVVADFDKTLTTAFENGEKRHSLIELIRKHRYLPIEYVEKAYALADQFRPMENDTSIPLDVRKERMKEWWKSHVEIQSEYGLNKTIVEKIVREQSLNGRKGLRTFLDTLSVKNIPLLILSASVTDLVEGFLKKDKLFFPNMHVISNPYAYDAAGNVTGYGGNIIHSLNKDETALGGMSYSKLVENRKNVLLLGDGIGDATMANGIFHEMVLKIGFLNDNVDAQLPAYKEAFDVIILNDGPMDFVNDLLGNFSS